MWRFIPRLTGQKSPASLTWCQVVYGHSWSSRAEFWDEDTNMSPAAISRVLPGHWYKVLVQIQRRGQRGWTTLPLWHLCVKSDTLVDVSTTHIEWGDSAMALLGNQRSLGRSKSPFHLLWAQAPDQVTCKAPGSHTSWSVNLVKFGATASLSSTLHSWWYSGALILA